MHRLTIFVVLALAGCADPQTAGQQVGQSLYNASVSTGRALATAGDRTGQALQSAGASVRNAFVPAPPYPDGAAPPVGQQALPPPGAPVQGEFFRRYDPPGYPASTGEPGDGPGSPANPAVGY